LRYLSSAFLGSRFAVFGFAASTPLTGFQDCGNILWIADGVLPDDSNA
jgi:hypothetical protein